MNFFLKINSFWSRYKQSKLAVYGAIVFFIYIFIAIFANLIMPYNPFKLNLDIKLSPPSKTNLWGTDQLGRDLLSRVIWGTRISLLIGISVTLISTLIGIIIGASGAFVGGWFDELTMRFTDFVYCLPTFFLLITVIGILGPNLNSIIIVMGATMWPQTARLIRAEILVVKELDYVSAARVCGVKGVSLLFYEVLPNSIYPVIVAATIRLGYAILYEASLSFLGLGDPSLVSWGWIIHESLSFIRVAWWGPIFPGLILSILTISVNLMGDGLNDALNPQLKER